MRPRGHHRVDSRGSDHGRGAGDHDKKPVLKVRCGLKVMLVLDESFSIRDFKAVDDVRKAARSFVEALLGTGSPLAITAFHSRARHGVPTPTGGSGYAEVTPGNIDTFKDWINNDSPGGY